MEIPSIKDLVKDNSVYLERFKSGNLFYRVTTKYQEHEDGTNARIYTFEFPVPVSDIGEAEMRSRDKAIYFMRYIKRAIADGTFIAVS